MSFWRKQMIRISENTIANCAFGAAIDFAEKYFKRNEKLPVVGELVSRSDTVSSFHVVLDTRDFSQFHTALEVESVLTGSIPYTTFVGVLTVRPHFNGCALSLEGLFNTTLPGPSHVSFGETMARESSIAMVRSLLHKIVASIESDWQQFIRQSPDFDSLNRRNERQKLPA